MTLTGQQIDAPPRSSVQEALAAVIADLPGIGRDDKSPEGYAYRGIEAVTKQVQPLLARHGVVFVPRATITDVRPSPAMKEGWTDVFMQVEWSIVGPDGSTILAQTTGIGRDRADKGANKAMTQAFKYLLLDVLCIADTKDDSDGQTYEHDRHERPAEPERVALPADLSVRLDALPPEAQERLSAWASRAGEPNIRSVPAAWVDAVERAVAAEEAKHVTSDANELAERAKAMAAKTRSPKGPADLAAGEGE